MEEGKTKKKLHPRSSDLVKICMVVFRNVSCIMRTLIFSPKVLKKKEYELYTSKYGIITDVKKKILAYEENQLYKNCHQVS